MLAKAWELFGKSIELVRANLSVFGTLFIVPLAFSLLGELSSREADVRGDWGFKASAPGISWITWVGIGGAIFLLVTLVGLFINMMTQAAALKAAHSQRPTLGQAWVEAKANFWRLLGVYVVAGLSVVIGLILLIVPGIIMLRRYYLAPYAVLDQKFGVWQALERSAAMSKPHSGSVYRIIGLSILLAIVGGIVSGFGLPVLGAIVSTMLGLLYVAVPALRYQELKALYKPGLAQR